MAITFAIVIALLSFLSPSHCLYHKQPPYTLRGLLAEEKARLGSTPPSCHNKCNQCHPCMAVQVPPLPPSHNRVQPSQTEATPSAGSNRYSNYKPLGWKCRCNGNFYNP
ncbi:EPIDERMAL PATTERNING FACTOR-like protein 1 [Forsythia ovata]|uniref:Epidermal patterning factor-like protein n=1 Tax=Forsythia ovata TaxID=205694 RepID=A0ABD1WNV5_9LAMI